jgi:hypothetical protein
MGQQRNDPQNPQAKRDNSEQRAGREPGSDDPQHEERFPGAEGRPGSMQANQQNREGGDRSTDQGRRDQQAPDRDRQQSREQGQGRSGDGSRANESNDRNQGGQRR